MGRVDPRRAWRPPHRPAEAAPWTAWPPSAWPWRATCWWPPSTGPGSDLNAVDDQLHADLASFFAALKRERGARAALLTGSKRAFSAGGDFDWFPSLRSVERLDHLRRDAKQMIWDLLDVEMPIVAGVNGPAVGLGASIALLCDVVVMAESAVIADPHVRVGIVAGDGGAAIWPLLVGPLLAKRYLLTGDPVTAADAERLGLVTEVAADAEVASPGEGVGGAPGGRRAARPPRHQGRGQRAAQAGAARQLRPLDRARAAAVPHPGSRGGDGRAAGRATAALRGAVARDRGATLTR